MYLTLQVTSLSHNLSLGIRVVGMMIKSWLFFQMLTNFLSSIMIHATKPFVESEKIQTKIEGQEVSGTVEV